MDTSDEWIRQRTGIRQRHYVAEGQTSSDLGYEASLRAIEAAGIEPSEIDTIICATMTADYKFPGSGGLIGARLGIPGVPCFDIQQQCATVPYTLQLANGLVSANAAATILLVGADAHAGFMPWKDWDVLYGEREGPVSPELYERATAHRGLAVIFGDGAGAMILRKSATEGHGFLGAELHTDGRYAEDIVLHGGGFRARPFLSKEMIDNEDYVPRMEGRSLFKHAVTKLPRVVRSLCAAHGVTLDEVDWFLPHQANDRINIAVRDALKLPHSKVPSNIARFGNTSSATIAILLDEMVRDGRIQRGQLLCMLALGAGLHWGATLLRY
jgi:3-oxoacyl-[acyl-carrier-protein] synthase-3